MNRRSQRQLLKAVKAYNLIRKLESQVEADSELAYELATLREMFAAETIQRVIQGFKAKGVSKTIRKQWLRKLVKEEI